tara:strand:- start:10019 stop:11311 length:1293 start_codon:yes stop_codon:yes gene_type:complete
MVSDDQRPDTIAALGNSVIETPSLDQLVRRGSTITRATCANPICVCSRAEILTGCSGVRNGVFLNSRIIDESLPRLPKPFAEAGYQTWYVGKWHNNNRPINHGYAQTHHMFMGGGAKWWKPQVDYRGQEVTGYKGWIFRDSDDNLLPELGVGLTPRTSEVIADAAIDIIQRSGDAPFFAHVNFTAPHDPLLIAPEFADRYDPESIPLPKNFSPQHPFDHGNAGGRDEVLLPLPRTPEDVRADIAAYYAVITHMDAQIGRVLDALDKAGKTDNTIIVFSSDHGLAMGSHGLRGKQNMYEHTIGVPMIFVGPSIPQDRRFAANAYLRDIFPTLCDLAGLDVPEVDGQSQVPVLRGKQDSVYDHIIGYFRDSQRMIRTDRWKLIEYPLAQRNQLFDLQSDPLELDDQSQNPDRQSLIAQLHQRLHRQIDAYRK